MAKLLAYIFVIVVLIVTPAYSQVVFTDVSESAGFRDLPTFWVTWGDYDNDGYADMVVSTNNGRRLYHNEGNGTFLDVTEVAGASGGSGMNAAYFLDFDNDGNLDLFMPGNGMGVSEHGDLLLQNKGDGTFVDVSQKAGLYPDGRKTKYSNKEATSFDYDNDGLLDIFISNGDTVPLVPNIFYHNEGNGRFKDIAAQIGLDNSRLAGIYPGDYDNDGDMDLFISVAGSDYWATDPNDQGVDQLWRNEGNGVFVDVAEEAGVQKNINSFMGFSFDYDNDGDLDLYLRQLPSSDALGYDVLYRNNGNGTFSNVAQQAGILQIEGYASGTDYGDYDNDGWLDICATYQPVGRTFLPVVLYHNNRDGTFADVSEQFNIASYINSDSGPDFVDYDSDGDLDIFLAITNALYRNNGTGNHWLQMKLVGSKSNRDAVGARARVIAGELSMIREIFSFSHSNHSDRLPLHFGLGVNQKG